MKRTDYYQQIPVEFYARRSKKAARLGRFAHHFPLVVFIVFLLVLAGRSLCAASTGSSVAGAVETSAHIAALIDKLHSDDSSVRQSAAAALTALGASARPAILKLVHSPDPGLRQQAAQILLDLPWYVDSDPPKVRELLLGYGSPEVELRRGLIAALAQVDNGAGLPALVRLIYEEPSPAVQWTIVSCLRQEGDLEPFKKIAAPLDNSRLLALGGYAKVEVDAPAAGDDLRRCAELEFTDPADDDGEFDFVIRVLCDLAISNQQYDQAADWRRREWARGSAADTEGVSTALVELFALQGDYGPLKGWQEDLGRAGDDAQKPKLQYAIACLYRRMGDFARAQAAQNAAFAASTTRLQRYDVGDFLCEHGWDTFAEAELNAYLKMDAKNDGFDPTQADANVHLRLAGLAVERGDDETAAHEKEQAMLLLPRNDPQLTRPDATGHRVPVPAAEVWSEIYWRYLRVAVAHHNEKEIDRRLEQLLQLRPTDSDIAIEVVPLLEQRGRKVDADDLFRWAFDDLKKDLDANPHDAESLNGLAWLCAECNRHLEEARQWAEQAVEASPQNAAILDTDAEVNYRLGKFADAVRLETEASSLEPSEPFMKKQLEKFKAAAGQAKRDDHTHN